MKRRFVILNEVKNLIGSRSSVGEILRLHLRMTLRHSLFAGMTKRQALKAVIPVETGIQNILFHLNSKEGKIYSLLFTEEIALDGETWARLNNSYEPGLSACGAL